MDCASASARASGIRGRGLGLGFRVLGFGFRVSGLGLELGAQRAQGSAILKAPPIVRRGVPNLQPPGVL